MIKNQENYSIFGKNILKAPLEKINTVFESNGIEISWYNNEIIWSQHSCLLHDFTVPGPIKQALICNIDDSIYLAVLYQSGLTLFSETGQTNLIPLPFSISKIYALHKALLLFRDLKFGFSHPQLQDFPIMFTLFHPLEEIRPVALSSHSASIAQCPNSPMPRFTSIPSPTPRKNTLEFQKPQINEEKELYFITDDSFIPLSLSPDHCFLLAQANKTLSIWKFTQQKISRDLLFSSPFFSRSPSIFSPPVAAKSLLSPGTAARAEVKATLEGIPPDLFMDQIYEFDCDFDKNCKIIELQNQKKHYVLVWCDLLKRVFVGEKRNNYLNDSLRIVATIDSVKYICKFQELQFFVISEDGNVLLYEEERMIADMSKALHGIKSIQQFGRKMIVQYPDNHFETFSFALTFETIISKILEVSYICLQPDLYSTLILTLSESNYLHSFIDFIPNFYEILISLKSTDAETGITNSMLEQFFNLTHLLYEDLSILKTSYLDSLALLKLLIPLGSHLGKRDHLLQYALDISSNLESEFVSSISDLLITNFNTLQNDDMTIPSNQYTESNNSGISLNSTISDISQNSEIEPNSFENSTLSSSQFNDESKDQVWDLKTWCGECTRGNAMLDFPSAFELSRELNEIFTMLGRGFDAKKIVETTERVKLRKWQIDELQQSIAIPLKECFREMAENPPEDWPIAAYQLIGREDLATLKNYVLKQYDKISSSAYNQSEFQVFQYQLPDLRHLEIERLLQSHYPVTIDVERPNGTDDIKFQSMNIDKLKQLLEKQWSLSVGRALFTYGTKLPTASDRLESFPLNEKGFTIASIELNVGDQMDVIGKDWANFHRGVASAFSVIDADQNWIQDLTSGISQNYTDNSHLNSNKIDESFTGGVIFGFGVTGLLKKLWKNDIFDLLNQAFEKETLATGTILGFGAAFRGSNDVGISHMISNRLPEISGGDIENEEDGISGIIKASSILSLGLILERTGQRHSTEIFIAMLQNIAEENLYRGAIASALGVAIGLINLGQGDSSRVLLENREKLTVLMEGNGGAPISTDITETFGNLDYYSTCPAAAFALILGYLETNNERVMKTFELPNDLTFINQMHPDMIIIRSMGVRLISSSNEMAENLQVPNGLSPDALIAYITGFALAAGIKFAGTMNEKVYGRLMKIAKCLVLLEKQPFDLIEATAIRRELSLALVLLAISFIKAGTNDIEFIKFARYVRRRNITTSWNELIYGFHMTIGQAIGIVNMGKGRFTLGNSIKDKAMMILSVFPRFPRFIGDNETVLQVMKELIGSAIVPRVLEVRNVDNGEIVKATIQIGMDDEKNSVFLYQAPHVIPPLKSIKSIIIDEPDFYSLEITNPFSDENIRPILWLKNRKVSILQNTDKSQNIQHSNKKKLPETNKYHIKQNQSESELLSEIGDNIFVDRMLHQMSENKFLNTQSISNKEKMKVIQHEIEWDANGEKIVAFMRSKSAKERALMILENKAIRDFLKFYGITPSWNIKDIGMLSDEALGFLIQFVSEDEATNALL